MTRKAVVNGIGVLALLIGTAVPVDHCNMAGGTGETLCSAAILAGSMQTEHGSRSDSPRDSAGHHLAPCCAGMLTMIPATSMLLVAECIELPDRLGSPVGPVIRTTDALRPPITAS